jgi:putative ABC transport system substrate-binding protein
MSWPLGGRAQQATIPVIGFLSRASPAGYEQQVAGFRRGLNEAGYMESSNVAIPIDPRTVAEAHVRSSLR